MPLAGAVTDPRFEQLSPEEQLKTATHYEPRLAEMPPEEAQKAIAGVRAKYPFKETEAKYGLPPGALHALGHIESGIRTGQKSPTGVEGLMQITKDTWKRYAPDEPYSTDPGRQIDVAGRIMADNLKRSGGDVHKAYAMYGDPKETGYADRVFGRLQMISGDGTISTPQTATAAESPSPIRRPPVPVPEAPRSFLGTLAYRTVGRLAASGNALAYALGEPGVLPPEKFAAVTGAPVSTSGALGAAADVAGAGLAAAGAPAAPIFTAAVYGLPALYQYATGSEAGADLLEAGIGAGALVKDVAKVGGSLVRMFRVPKSVAEYKTILGAAGQAKDLVAAEQRKVEAAREAATVAETRVREAATAHETALRTSVETPPKTMPKGDVVYALGLDPNVRAPTIAERGQALQESMPATAHAIAKRRAAAYTEAEGIADRLDVKVPFLNAMSNEIRDTGKEYYDVLKEAGGSKTEQRLALELANLGGEVMENPTTGELIVRGGAGEDIAYSRLSKLYAQMRNVGLNPREYAVSNDRAGKVFTSLTNKLGQALHELELSDPELYAAGQRARQIVREVEVPYRQSALRVLGRSKTPVTAAKATVDLPASIKDSTHLKRILMAADAPHKEAVIHGLWDDLLDVSKEHGEINLERLATQWNRVPDDVKNVMSMASEANASASMDELLARHSALKDFATKSAAEQERALAQVKLATTEAKTQAKKVTEAIRSMAAEQKKQRSLVRQGEKKLASPAYRRGAGGMFARFHIVSAFMAAVHGNIPLAMFQGAYAYWMMKHPLTVAEALKTPAETFNGARIAAALGAMTQSWNGVDLKKPLAPLGRRPTGARTAPVQPAAPTPPPSPAEAVAAQ